MVRIKNVFLLGLAVCISVLGVACGGSSDTTTTTSAVTISGTVNAPTTSATVSAQQGFALKKASGVTAGVAASEEYKICNMADGTELATGTTDTDGKFSAEIGRTVLNPDGEASLTVKIIFISESGYSSFGELTLTADASTLTLDADVNSALAASSMATEAGLTPDFTCAAWSLSGKDLDFDPACFFKMEKFRYKDGDPSKDTLAGAPGGARDVFAAALGGGVANPFQVFREYHQDPEVFQTEHATEWDEWKGEASVYSGLPTAIYGEDLDTKVVNESDVRGIVKGRFAGGAGLVAYTLKGAATVADASVCDSCKDDDDYCENFIKQSMGYDSVGDLDTITEDSECVHKMHETLDEFKGEDGAYDFEGGEGNIDPEMMAGQFKSIGPEGCATISGEDIKGAMEFIPTGGWDDCAGGDKNNVGFGMMDICKAAFEAGETCDMQGAMGFLCAQDKVDTVGVDYHGQFGTACGGDNAEACKACIDPTSPTCLEHKEMSDEFRVGYCGDGVCGPGESLFCEDDLEFCSPDELRLAEGLGGAPVAGNFDNLGLDDPCMSDTMCGAGFKCEGAVFNTTNPMLSTPGQCKDI